MMDQEIKPVGADENAETGSRGRLFILSAPSGAGKTTLCSAVLSRFPDMLYSVSYTTRAPRCGEKEGIDYHFITKDEFEKRLQRGLWAEWAGVHGNYYGTSAEFVDKGLASGRDILLDIDVQGALQLLKRYPNCITVFVLPPSLDILRARLESRGTEQPAAIAVRLAAAEKELAQKDLYRHVIVNDQLESAVAELISVMERYRSVEK